MEAKHTPEPWAINYVKPAYWIETERDEEIASIIAIYRGDGELQEREMEANAHRIVACVNACEGIPNEVLERGFVMAAIEEEQKVWVATNRYKRKEG